MALVDVHVNDPEKTDEAVRQEVQTEVEQIKRELREINLLLEQSQMEVSRLAQKNAAVTARLQQIQSHFDSVPREDILEAFNDAMDAQQRLFVMRGQSEKLQSDKEHLDKYLMTMEKVVDTFSKTPGQPQGKKGSERVLNLVEAIIQAQEEERQRLSRQMHDGPAQALSNFILQTEIAVRLFDIDLERSREELAILKSSATSAFQQVRDFVFELRPMMLDDLGLVPTLKRYIEAYKEQSNTNIRLMVNGVERRFEGYIEVIIFRAIQEILTFSVRQAQATQISVQMNIADSFVKVTMDDNGKSENTESMLDGRSMGVKVIKDRVEMMGGFFEIDHRPGKGTQVIFQVPIGKTQAVFQ
jgi:two-component system sensor histidine kinase DegS